jgi:hypothetical protein
MPYRLDNRQEFHRVLQVLLRRGKLELHRHTIDRIVQGRSVNLDTCEAVEEAHKRWNEDHPDDPKIAPQFVSIEIDNGGRALKLMAPPLRKMGAVALYYGPGDNQRRNEAKEEALRQAKGKAFLLAQTGTAYFSAGGFLSPHVMAFLRRDKGNTFVAVLMNPFSEAALKLYLTCIEAAERVRTDAADVVAGHLGKLRETLGGYRNDFRGHSVSLRFTPFDPVCTVLLTGTRCFVEPYFQFDPIERRGKHLDTYEWELENRIDQAEVTNKPLADHFRASSEESTAQSKAPSHMSFHLRRSQPADEFVKHLAKDREQCEQTLKRLADKGVLQHSEAKAVKGQLAELQRIVKEALR